MHDDLSEPLRRFQEEMDSPDEVLHVLLKGHLVLEETLTRILEQYVFHPDHLDDARLSFNHKLSLARSLCLRMDTFDEWELLGAINGLRNEVAHNLRSPSREKKLAKVRDLYYGAASTFEDLEQIKAGPDSLILLAACAHCAGFLASFERDSKAFRKLVHSMDRGLNPDKPEFDLPQKSRTP